MSVEFKRPLSPFITDFFAARAALESRVYNTVLAAEITLTGELAETLNYATKTITVDSLSSNGASVNITPINFSARVTGSPEIRHSQAKPVDASEIDVVNLDYLISEVIPASERPFDNASVIVYICFPKPNGNYEGLIYFIGKISDITGDDLDAHLASVSDVAIKASTAGREVTQRCVNVLGDSWCGVNLLPVGAVCSKIQDDKEAGCIYWGGVFNGVGYINPGSRVQGYTGPISEGGFDTGQGYPLYTNIHDYYRNT